jgi:alkanesulfonate monooxygenase SsuD/methylene tetrahydromethanopterin reductase-like flavin-dependent oxidoreductase (luciferase family)
MLRLAGEEADGVVLVNATPTAIAAMLQRFWAGVDARGGDRAAVDVVCRVGVALDEDDAALRTLLRREVAGYGSTQAYNAFFARQGFRPEADAMRAAWARKDGQAAAAAVSDAMLDALFAFGDAGRCRARLEAYYAAGVRTLVVMPLSAREAQARREAVWRTIEFAAAELAPQALSGSSPGQH